MENLVGKTYRHFKNKACYIILEICTNTETGEKLVIYQNVDDNDDNIWARPYDMFFEKVDVDGVLVDRMELIIEGRYEAMWASLEMTFQLAVEHAKKNSDLSMKRQAVLVLKVMDETKKEINKRFGELVGGK